MSAIRKLKREKEYTMIKDISHLWIENERLFGSEKRYNHDLKHSRLTILTMHTCLRANFSDKSVSNNFDQSNQKKKHQHAAYILRILGLSNQFAYEDGFKFGPLW